MPELRDCSDEEFMVLVAIAELASNLPRNLVDYTRALGEMNRRYFYRDSKDRKRGDHNPSPGSVALTRDVRATPKWK